MAKFPRLELPEELREAFDFLVASGIDSIPAKGLVEQLAKKLQKIFQKKR